MQTSVGKSCIRRAKAGFAPCFIRHYGIEVSRHAWPRIHRNARRRQALSAQGASHPHPETVTDSLFRDSAFFDPNDLVQIKYEMLRSVQKEGRAVVEAAQAFGLSRPVFYVTQAVFQREGLPGLLPRKRGPKRPHKLNDEAMTVLLEAIQAAGRMPKGEELATLLAERCGVEVHPRSILRRLRPYLRQEEKKRP